MKQVLAYPTYENLHSGCGYIVQQMLATDVLIPEVIIALSRGGLIPGVIISHMLESLGWNNKVVPVAYSSKSGNGDGKNHDNVLPVLSNKTILVVDDIADGGHTMDEVVRFYEQSNNEQPPNRVTSAVLYYKESSIHTPRLWWQKIPADSPWIVFPFEV